MKSIVETHTIVLKVMAYSLVPQRVTETASGHECFVSVKVDHKKHRYLSLISRKAYGLLYDVSYFECLP
jgi:hypothetical protein